MPEDTEGALELVCMIVHNGSPLRPGQLAGLSEPGLLPPPGQCPLHSLETSGVPQLAPAVSCLQQACPDLRLELKGSFQACFSEMDSP